MIDNVKEITGGRGSNLFLFTEADALRASRTVLDLELITGTRARLTLAN